MQPEPTTRAAGQMTRSEIRAGASLAGVFGLRMLGLFFILPVFALHAPQLVGGGDLTLVGIALGIYGLTQGILQIPFGMASDRWGRKPVIYAGLVVFAAGSFLAAAAGDIWTAIAGRALQGAGAISSVVMALAADLTREQHRSKVMAMIGATIGATFALSLVVAPPLYRSIGMGGLFVITGLLALGAIWVVQALVPGESGAMRAAPHAVDRPVGGGGVFLERELLRLNAGIFVLHFVLYAMFLVVPAMIVHAGLELAAHWKLYLPVVLGSFALMLPPILYADRRNQAKQVMVGCVALLAAVLAAFAAAGADAGLLALAGLLLGFFAAFNVLEALLPSLVSRIAPAHGRGAAIGVYNTAQTLGLFCGGVAGGWIGGRFGAGGVFGACTALTLAWFALAAGMRAVNPQRAEALYIRTVLDQGDRDGIRK
jgi:MFS family permease